MNFPTQVRLALSRVLGREVPADEEVHRTLDDLDAYVANRDRLERMRANQWQFSNVPELVVQVVRSDGERVACRLAGGTGTTVGSALEDATARAYCRTLIGLAEQHLANTEPTSTMGVGR